MIRRFFQGLLPFVGALALAAPAQAQEIQVTGPLAGAPADYVELAGDPAAALAAASGDLDLLLVGSRSYGPLGAVLLGAVTRRLVHAAQCPLMVVPRTRDASWDVALVGGMEATVE